VDVIFSDAKEKEREVLVEVAGPGDLLGFVDVDTNSDGRRQLFAARARTRCEIGVLTRERISAVADKLGPNALISLAEHINTWWSEKMERRVRFARLGARERLESVLAELAEKCGVEDAHGRLITSSFSHDDFASMIGSSRPMATRLVCEMVAQGRLLRRDRRYVLCDGPKTNSRCSIARKRTIDESKRAGSYNYVSSLG
jgi:CRP-like cAMP-binding protein